MIKSSNLSRKTSLAKNNKSLKIFIGAEEFKRDVEEILSEHGFITEVEPDPKKNAYQILENLFLKFHRIANQLGKRYDNRKTIEMNDEYDVQDLLHALLLEHFRDVRPEEYTPSYAGKSARTDFLLKVERIFIEVKKIRVNLNDKKLIDELIIDKAHYRTHPDCDTLFCLVYDPNNFLDNPEAIEDDLSDNVEGFETKVYVVPKRW